ncbi:MAG: hypothetical protein IMZ62_15655 [Chloroflexi bacterium]|nr:hypothetical protein [Chloroflexota bacterium]
MPTGRSLALLALAFAFLTLTGVNAEPKPDFTGTWTRTEPALQSGSSYMERVEQHGSDLKVVVDSSGTFAGFHLEHEYTIGGGETSTKDSEGRTRTVSVDWDGETLVFVTSTTEGANVTTVREVWSLPADGQTLNRSRTTTSWRGTTVEKSAFARQSRDKH